MSKSCNARLCKAELLPQVCQFNLWHLCSHYHFHQHLHHHYRDPHRHQRHPCRGHIQLLQLHRSYYPLASQLDAGGCFIDNFTQTSCLFQKQQSSQNKESCKELGWIGTSIRRFEEMRRGGEGVIKTMVMVSLAISQQSTLCWQLLSSSALPYKIVIFPWLKVSSTLIFSSFKVSLLST